MLFIPRTQTLMVLVTVIQPAARSVQRQLDRYISLIILYRLSLTNEGAKGTLHKIKTMPHKKLQHNTMQGRKG